MNDLVWWVLGGLFLLGLIPLLGFFRRFRTRGKLVLWCRRFSTPDLEVGKRNRWLWAVITEACRGEAIPVTLRDRSFAGSQSIGQSMQNPLATILILAGIPVWLWIMLAVLDKVDGSFVEFLVCIGGLVLYIIMFRYIGMLTVSLTSKAATFDGEPGKIERRLAKIRKRGWNGREIEAIRCTDDNWQDCVLAVLKSVDAVIIDCVDASSNIDWEIEKSREMFSQETIHFLLDEGMEAPEGVTPLYFSLPEAEAEIEALKSKWGEDDFGEQVELGEFGKALADRLRERLGGR